MPHLRQKRVSPPILVDHGCGVTGVQHGLGLAWPSFETFVAVRGISYSSDISVGSQAVPSQFSHPDTCFVSPEIVVLYHTVGDYEHVLIEIGVPHCAVLR